ncbi:MAG: TldD/PmbA family protein [Syntrophorhabdaceae bacterium]|nr:TldD/PmbA family protein [Syntrophorhabdaceae bacterium]
MDIGRIEKKAGLIFDSYEVFYKKTRVKKFETREGELSSAEIKEEEGIAFRAIKDNRMTFSYTLDTSDYGMETLVDNAASLLPYMERDETFYFSEKWPQYPDIRQYDEAGLREDDKKKIDMIADMEKEILSYDRRIVATRNCELNEAEVFIKIFNSKGLFAEGRKTVYTVSALAVAKERDEVSWYDWIWSNSLSTMDTERLGRMIGEKTITFLSSRQIETGVYQGILTPRTSCEILELLSGSFLGENLYKDKTKLKGRQGQPCFSSCVNIVDSGIKGIGAFPFDGEGTPSKENGVVRDGVFTGFLYDSYYGKKLGVATTGNSVRGGVKEPPRCGIRGLYIKETEEDVLGAIKEGLIIEDLMGTHMANPVTGDFSLGAAGYIVKNGDKRPFKGVIFSGNIFDLMKNVKKVGSDFIFLGGCGSPSLLVEGLKISGV